MGEELDVYKQSGKHKQLTELLLSKSPRIDRRQSVTDDVSHENNIVKLNSIKSSSNIWRTNHDKRVHSMQSLNEDKIMFTKNHHSSMNNIGLQRKRNNKTFQRINKKKGKFNSKSNYSPKKKKPHHKPQPRSDGLVVHSKTQQHLMANNGYPYGTKSRHSRNNSLTSPTPNKTMKHAKTSKNIKFHKKSFDGKKKKIKSVNKMASKMRKQQKRKSQRKLNLELLNIAFEAKINENDIINNTRNNNNNNSNNNNNEIILDVSDIDSENKDSSSSSSSDWDNDNSDSESDTDSDSDSYFGTTSIDPNKLIGQSCRCPSDDSDSSWSSDDTMSDDLYNPKSPARIELNMNNKPSDIDLTFPNPKKIETKFWRECQKIQRRTGANLVPQPKIGIDLFTENLIIAWKKNKPKIKKKSNDKRSLSAGVYKKKKPKIKAERRSSERITPTLPVVLNKSKRKNSIVIDKSQIDLSKYINNNYKF